MQGCHRKLHQLPARRMKKVFLGLTVVTSMTVVLLINLNWQDQRDTPPYAPAKTYLTVECADGRRLGNVLFDYAALIGIAKRHNMTAVMPDDFPLIQVFRLQVLLVPNLERTLGLYHKYAEYGRRASAFDPRLDRLPAHVSHKLYGYLQSWKYFRGAEKELKAHFIFHDVIMTQAKDFMSEVTRGAHTEDSPRRDSPGRGIPPGEIPSDVIPIGVHVRRGDILDPYYQNYGYTTPDSGYYTHALQHFRDKFPDKNVIFVVCSDDVTWCKENIRGQDVIYSEGHPPEVDLAILSLCKHTVISVGSFGWWGAWLANGTTLYYDGWPRPFSMLEYHVDKRDYFPPNWTSFT